MLDPEEEYYKLLEVYSKNVIASKTDLKGKIAYVSEAFCDISGYTREELMGQPHSIVRHEDTPSSLFEDLWKTIKATKTFNAEIKNKKKNGDYYWVDLTVSPIMDDFNNVIGYGAVRHDITGRKRIEELNTENEKLIDSFSKHVIASKTDLLGNITYVTDAFCDISGYKKEELIGKAHNIVRHPEMTKEFYRKLWKSIKSGKSFYGEVRNKKKDGSDYWVNVAISQDIDKDGNHIGYSAIRSDISKQKELEELLVKQNNEIKNLEEKIREKKA